MATRPATFTFGDAVNAVGQQGARANDDSKMLFALNAAFTSLWNFADWNISIAKFPPFYLTPSIQEFGKPLYAVPSDFHGFREVYCVDISTDSLNRWPLKVQENIELTYFRDWPKTIKYDPSTGRIRIHPRTPDGFNGARFVVEGTYKKRAPKVTMDTLNTLLPWDDEYFFVFCSFVFWALQTPGSKQKAAAFQEALAYAEKMSQDEGLAQGDPSYAPEYALVDGSAVWW